MSIKNTNNPQDAITVAYNQMAKLIAHLNGEHTADPYELALEFANNIPEEQLKDPNFKFYDRAAGGGGNGVAVYERLVDFHSKEHIINEMIYLADNCPFKVSIMKRIGFKNVYHIDSLTESIPNMKPTLEIFNPPYTEKIGNFNKPVYIDHINKFLEPEGGKVGIPVCPRAWFVADTGGRKVFRNKLFENGLKLIKQLPDDIWGDTATVQTCYFVVDKSYKGPVTVTDENGDSYQQEYVKGGDNYIFASKALNNIVRKVMPTGDAARFNFDNIYPTTKNMVRSSTPVKTIVKLKGGGNSEFELGMGDWITADNDKYRITHNFMGGLNRFAVDQMGILEPGINNKKGYIQIACNTKAEADNINSLLRTKLIRYVVDATRTSRTLSNTQFKFVPFYNDRLWTDEMAYEFFNITPEEVKVIEDYEPKGA